METVSQRRVWRLRCSMQNYDSGVNVDEIKPYAEFWMGTHESGPFFILQSYNNGVSIGSESVGLSLNSWIAKDPSVLGDKVIYQWGVTLPFLFKVLSIAKAGSIQAHPDKELAEFLHKTMPGVFKDDNHKPEMALALTDLEALCGFISLKDVISKALSNLKCRLNQGFPEILQGVPLNRYTRRYLPPFHECEVDCCILPKGASAVFPAVPAPPIFVVMEGEGTMYATSFEDVVREGDALFAPANTDISLRTFFQAS